LHESFAGSGTLQRRGNVFVVQNPVPGLPCGLEGCLRNVRSHSLCLDQMPIESVIRALDEALAVRAAAGNEGGAAPRTPLFNG
jgi:heptosyltransferase-3